MEWINQIPVFLLVFVRVSSFFMAAPIFMSRDIPAPFKIGLAFFLSLLALSYPNMPDEMVLNSQYWLLLLKEALVGLSIGFVASLLLYAVQTAGIFIDMQVGFAMATIFDPQSGIQTPLTGRFQYILATLFLLALNGHHYLIRGLFRSFEMVAVNQWIPAAMDGRLSTYLVQTFSHMFAVALLMAVPVAGALFLVDVTLGIIARTVPQMNVFVVGLPIKIMANFLILLVVLPGFFMILRKLFQEMAESIQAIIQILGA